VTCSFRARRAPDGAVVQATADTFRAHCGVAPFCDVAERHLNKFTAVRRAFPMNGGINVAGACGYSAPVSLEEANRP
jgi:hypothetical protein